MTKLSSFFVLFVLAAPVCLAQTPTTQAQIDRTWLTVDTTAKIATFQLTAGLSQLNGGLNFNGFNDGKLTLTVPTNWTVVLRFANHDANLPHSVEVIDTTKAMPAGPVDPPAFAHATTVAARLLQGLGSGETDSVRFVANKTGSYMIFCAVPGHGLAGMWIRLTVSPTEKRPTLTSSSS
jgi:sulfocyanin